MGMGFFQDQYLCLCLKCCDTQSQVIQFPQKRVINSSCRHIYRYHDSTTKYRDKALHPYRPPLVGVHIRIKFCLGNRKLHSQKCCILGLPDPVKCCCSQHRVICGLQSTQRQHVIPSPPQDFSPDFLPVSVFSSSLNPTENRG